MGTTWLTLHMRKIAAGKETEKMLSAGLEIQRISRSGSVSWAG